VKYLGQNALGTGGKMGGYLIANRFNNQEKMPYVKSPVVFIHGKRDQLIPYDHSVVCILSVKLDITDLVHIDIEQVGERIQMFCVSF
jgi:hypothetical protein